MKHLAFFISLFFLKNFTKSDMFVFIFHICTCNNVTDTHGSHWKCPLFREKIFNLTRNTFISTIFNISIREYQRHIMSVHCVSGLKYTNIYPTKSRGNINFEQCYLFMDLIKHFWYPIRVDWRKETVTVYERTW